MRKLFFYLFASLIMTASLVVSCNRNDDDNTENAASGGSATLYAKNHGFDGGHSGEFKSTKAGIAKTTAAGLSILTISGIKDGGKESINIVLYGDFSVPGTFALGSGSQNGIVIRKDYQNVTDQAMSYSTDNNGASMTGGGEVKITSVNGNKIEGTFYAIGFNNAQKEAYAEQGTFSGIVN